MDHGGGLIFGHVPDTSLGLDDIQGLLMECFWNEKVSANRPQNKVQIFWPHFPSSEKCTPCPGELSLNFLYNFSHIVSPPSIFWSSMGWVVWMSRGLVSALCVALIWVMAYFIVIDKLYDYLKNANPRLNKSSFTRTKARRGK
jgi:hypothetical protein